MPTHSQVSHACPTRGAGGVTLPIRHCITPADGSRESQHPWNSGVIGCTLRSTQELCKVEPGNVGCLPGLSARRALRPEMDSEGKASCHAGTNPPSAQLPRPEPSHGPSPRPARSPRITPANWAGGGRPQLRRPVSPRRKLQELCGRVEEVTANVRTTRARGTSREPGTNYRARGWMSAVPIAGATST
jgi:hypothetical protein